MNAHPELVLSIGLIFFLGLSTDILARKTHIPRVTLLIIIGIFIGSSGLDILPHILVEEWFSTITTIALGMIGFLLGEKFTLPALKKSGLTVLSIALGKVFVTFSMIIAVFMLIDIPFPVVLILASIATATAPAAVYEVAHEMKVTNKFVSTLLAVVALDDVLGMLLFSLVLAVLSTSQENGIFMILSSGLIEVLGSLILGYIFGIPIAKLTGRIKRGEPTMIEALGSVFLISGLAQLLELSPILAAIAMGSSVSTFAVHHTRNFHAIENIQWPFMIIFFMLAGASLEIDTLSDIGIIGIIYITTRIIGIYIGSRLGARLSGSSKVIENWMGLALTPQAGVAIGMALMASQRYEEYSHIILPITLGTTVIFELFGPLATKFAIKQSLISSNK